MQRTNDEEPELGSEARRVLAEALRALELERAHGLIGDTTHCLTTDRVRRIADSSAAATVPEQRHACACERCNSRVRAFQRAKSVTSEHRFETALQEARAAAPALTLWIAWADRSARALLGKLLRERHGRAPAAGAWLLTHHLAQELRAARYDGASPAASAHLVAATIGAAGAVAHDVLSPWTASFDAAWPMLELFRAAAREASLAGEAARQQFARGYARVAAGSPTYLRATLVGGIESLAEGLPDAEELIDSVSTEVAILDPVGATHPLLAVPTVFLRGGAGADADPVIRSLVAEWRDATAELASTASANEAGTLIATRLRSWFELLLSRTDDPVASLLQLHVIRRYLSDLTSSIDHETVHHVAAEALIAYAADPRSSVFLAMEACSAFAAEALSYARILMAMLTLERAELRHGIVVALRRAYEGQSGPGGRLEARYIPQNSGWTFAGGVPQPLDEPARELAVLAARHPDLVESLAWFNQRSEPATDTERVLV